MKNKYSTFQLAALMLLRYLIGWHMLYEGIHKLLNPAWTAKSFLSESQWIFSRFAEWIVTNNNVLSVVDFLNIWGLIAIGLGLILGLFTNVASWSGCALLLLYYISTPPLTGLGYSIPSEGNYLVFNKNLIEAAALLVLIFFPTGMILGFDRLIFKYHNNNKNIDYGKRQNGI